MKLTKLEQIFIRKKLFIIFWVKKKLKSKEQRILNSIVNYFNKLHDDLLEQNNYQGNIYGLDFLFNDDAYYKPAEIKSAFNGKYILYESNGDKDNLLSIREYFFKIKLYLYDLIEFYNTIGEWKKQLFMRIAFISFTDATERQILHSKSHNVETMRGIDANEIIEGLIDSFIKRYQERLETKMQGSSYTFERVELHEYHFHKVSLNRGNSYIPPPIGYLTKNRE